MVSGGEQETVTIMQQQVEHLVRLVDDSLDVSRTKEQAPPKERSTPTSRRRILIVEDNVGTAKVLARLLSKLGDHEIQMAHDGLSALDIAQTQRPEIVLSDIGLPKLNGYDVAKRLRKQPGVPADRCGGGDRLWDRGRSARRSAEIGFDRHLVKPTSLS